MLNRNLRSALRGRNQRARRRDLLLRVLTHNMRWRYDGLSTERY
jgi:hypothetical protein